MDMELRTDIGENDAASGRLGGELRCNDLLAQLKQELRTPLNTIIGFAELLEVQCDKASMTDNVNQILRAAHRSLDIINRELTQPSRDASNGTANTRCDVLHIEDDSISFASVKLLLRNTRKLKVLQATSGKSGISLAQTHTPKLILLDLNLPDIHGSEVIKQLQKEPATARIPVIVLSGDTTPSQIERMLVLGATKLRDKTFQGSRVPRCSGRSLGRRNRPLDLTSLRALINEVIKLRPVESRQKAPPPRMASRNILPLPIVLPFCGTRASCWR